MADLGTFPKAVVGIVIAVLIVASLAIPVVADYTDTTYVKYNNTTGHLSKIVNEDATVEYSVSGSTITLTVNDVAITSPASDVVIISDTAVVKIGSLSSTVDVVANGSLTGLGYVTAFNAEIDFSEKTIAFSDITYAEGHTGSTSVTSDAYSWAFVADNAGTYSALVTSATASTLYVNDADDLYGSRVSGTTLYTFHGETVKGNATTTTATMDITTHDITNVSGVKSVSVNHLATGSDIVLTVGDTDLSPTNIIMPAKVVGDKTDQVMYRTVINIIPLLLVIGIVIGAVSLVVMKRQ